MTGFERSELAIIALAMLLAWPLLRHLPDHPSIGGLLTTAAATLLGQGLLRDIALLATARSKGPKRRQACLCVESLVGVSAVVGGIALALWQPAWCLAAGRPTWAMVFGLTLLAGFLQKDLVITWWPPRLRRDRNHLNVIVTWR